MLDREAMRSLITALLLGESRHSVRTPMDGATPPGRRRGDANGESIAELLLGEEEQCRAPCIRDELPTI